MPRASRQGEKVTLYEASGRGGICHYTYQLAEGLERLGIDVTVITTSSYELKHLPRHFRASFRFRPSLVKRLIAFGMRLVSRPSVGGGRGNPGREGAPHDFGRLRRIRSWILKLKTLIELVVDRPDLIHFQRLDHREDRLFMRALRLLGFPLVYTAHDLLPHDSDSPGDYEALAQIYGLADRIIVHAEQNRRELLSLFDVEERRVTVIPHGSYDFLFASERLSKQEARRKLNLSTDKKVVLFFGIIKRYKGLEYLVEAFDEVRSAVPDAILLVVGSIYSRDTDGFTYYSRLIQSLRGRDDITCVPEYVPVERIGYYLSASDVMVLPYTKTYHSGVLLAAYAAGRPVVVTDTGGLPEVVESGRSGFVVPPRDTSSLAKAIVRILRSPEYADAMGRYAGRLASTEYSWDRIAARTRDLYREILLARSHARAGGLARAMPADPPEGGRRGTAPAPRD